MVYERLPIKTVHHRVKIEDFAFWSHNHQTRSNHLASQFLEEGPRFNTPSSDWPVYSIKVVHTTMSSMAILGTCQQINLEAGEILHPLLRAIGERPAQVIVNSISLCGPDMEDVITRLSYADTAYWINRSRLLDRRMRTLAGRPKNRPKSRPVHVAIRNSFLDRNTAEAPVCEFKMECLRSYFYLLFHYDLVTPIRITTCFPDGPFPHIDRNVHVRIAGLTPREKEAYDIVQPLKRTSTRTCSGCKSSLSIDSGDIIGEAEWDKEWAEGEKEWI
jgi:hypothetical protein